MILHCNIIMSKITKVPQMDPKKRIHVLSVNGNIIKLEYSPVVTDDSQMETT